MNEDMCGRTYEGHPANFIELTGPSLGYVRFSSNGEIRTLKRAEWNLLTEWNMSPPPISVEHERLA